MNNNSIIWWAFLFTISCIICYQDITKRTISNQMCIIVLIICICLVIKSGNYYSLYYSVIIFFVGFILFIKKIIAAGDVKLISSFFIAINQNYQLLTFTIILLAGGVISIVLLTHKVINKKNTTMTVPYGVPICIGCLFGIAASL
ncbi:prepilin peptidase [Aliivibrio fischeri]|uniref:A24 family peptidase n=1 Tax=Aliivibrio fischeri TaxID=668 RepID=UPI0007C558DB|nr:prepilin peptidase [Aliivibrio fischeri]MCE7535857.1 prepilin peptidase [Aliivibrio fischeri]MCE7558519.1 prepilin peptidase [Aliivibrio fischeri]MCE7577225.1 prepilin peptidase [Aliivibrio fischeri]MCE7589514.1 prepilin peptidase [Aliivibrio fischeri]TGA68955.1 prepilin peptidase [Aliivibrio fischeri]